MDSDSQKPSASYAYRALLGGALIIGLLLLLLVFWYASHAILLSFGAVLLAILLRGMADWLAARLHLAEPWALATVVLALVVLLTVLGAIAAPRVAEQATQLRQQLPEAFAALYQTLTQQPWGRWLLDMLPTAEELQEGGLGFLARATGLAYTAVQLFFGLFILFFVTLYLAINPQLYVNGMLHLVPMPYRPRAGEVLAAIGATLRWWIIGTIIRMVAVGGLTFAGLSALDIPLAMILALLAGLLDFVPYFGPIVAAIPAVLLALSAGFYPGLYVIILYAAVQQIENLIISPLVYHRTIYLPPVLTIIAQIILFAMAGILGVLLATPLAAVALVLVKMLYVEQTLGDYQIERPEQQIDGKGVATPDSGRKEDNSGDHRAKNDRR